MELREARRDLAQLEASRERDMAQLTQAVGTGREAAEALKAVQAAKDAHFSKLVALRAEPNPNPNPITLPLKKTQP